MWVKFVTSRCGLGPLKFCSFKGKKSQNAEKGTNVEIGDVYDKEDWVQNWTKNGVVSVTKLGAK